MKKWTNPELTNLSVEETNEDFQYDCMQGDIMVTKGPHKHCPVCKESSSSCNHVDWTPIGPSTPIQS